MRLYPSVVHASLALGLAPPLVGCGSESGGGPAAVDTGNPSNSGTGGSGTSATEEPYEPIYGRFGDPGETFTLPAPGPGAGLVSLVHEDLQTEFPLVHWDTLDRLYLPAGEYERIRLGGLPMRERDRPLVITNIGGQVLAGGHDAGHPMVISGGSHWVLTGRFDPESLTGDEAFVGHAEGRFAYSQGTYGIVLDDKFSREGTSGLAIGGGATAFEVDMIEIARAEFAGLVVKTDDNGDALMHDVRLHDLYVHDVGSEGLYLGSTQTQPQHAFENLEIYDNRFIRTGTEALQVGQLGDGCEIHHNVIGPGAIRWRSAFADYQNGNVQYGQRYGSSAFHHNIVIAAGDLLVEFFPQPVAGDSHGSSDEVAFTDNYFADSSLAGVYTHAEENSVVVRFERNFFRGFRFSYDEVYPDTAVPGAVFGVGSNTLNAHLLVDNQYQAPFPFVQWHFDSVTEEGNLETNVARPVFRDFMGPLIDDNYRQVEWWTDVATRHPQQVAVVYGSGATVMHGGVLYSALRENSGIVPGTDGDTWQSLGMPADDVRLAADSPYQGLGLRWPPQ